MRRFVSLATLLVGSSLLAGCPIYPVDSCYSSYDCPSGYACDSYLGQCVAEPNGDDDDAPAPPQMPAPVPPDRDRSCSSPEACLFGETCAPNSAVEPEQPCDFDAPCDISQPTGYCLPGDCTFWGCLAGYACTESTAGMSYSCVKEGPVTEPIPAACTSSAIDAPASGEVSFTDGDEKLSFCLAGFESDRSTSSLQAGGELAVTSAVGEEAFQTATLTVEGQLASDTVLHCNDLAALVPVTCVLTLRRESKERQVEYTTSNRTYDIVFDAWTDTAFVGRIDGVTMVKTVSALEQAEDVQSTLVTDVQINVRSAVGEGSGGVEEDDGGGRPPPAP